MPGVSFFFLKDTGCIKSHLLLASHLILVYLFKIPITNTEQGVRALALLLIPRRNCLSGSGSYKGEPIFACML